MALVALALESTVRLALAVCVGEVAGEAEGEEVGAGVPLPAPLAVGVGVGVTVRSVPVGEARWEAEAWKDAEVQGVGAALTLLDGVKEAASEAGGLMLALGDGEAAEEALGKKDWRVEKEGS